MNTHERLGGYKGGEDETTGIAQTVSLTSAEYDILKNVVKDVPKPPGRNRTQWDLAFNVDSAGDIFPYVRSGRTPQDERQYVRGTNDLLDSIADRAVKARKAQGRFFVNSTGVFYKDKNTRLIQCLRFDIKSPPRQ